MTEDELKYHRDIFQSSNLNFLIGSGLSRPYPPTLGNIEKQIEELENYVADENVKEYALVTLFIPIY